MTQDSLLSPVEHHYARDAQMSIALFGLILTGVFTSVYLIARVGFETPLWPLAKILSVSWFVLLMPYGYRTLARYRGWSHAESWLNSDSFLMLAALMTLVLAGEVTRRFGVNLYPLLGGIGALLVAVFVADYLRGRTVRPRVRVWVGTVIFGLFIAGLVWGLSPHGGDYLNPLYQERLMLSLGNKDTLFHASISNMIWTYQLPSTGLDGVSLLAYHFGSHWMFAQIAGLLDLPVFDFYHVGYPLIFVPLFFASVMTFAYELRRWFQPEEEIRLSRDRWFWLMLTLVTVSVFPYSVQISMGVLWEKYIISESYAVSLLLMLWLFGISLAIARPLRGELRRVPAREAFALIVLVPLLIALIGYTKISGIALIMSAYAYLLWRLSLNRSPAFLLSFSLSALLTVIIYLATSGSAEESSFFPLAHVIHVVGLSNIALWIVVYLCWTWVLLIVRLSNESMTTLADVARMASDKRLLDVEIVLVFAIAGAIPGLILDMPIFAVGYFYDTQYWVAGAVLLAYAPLFLRRHQPFGGARLRFSELTLRQLAMRVLLSLAILGVVANVLTQFPTMISFNLKTRAALIDPARTWVEIVSDDGFSALINAGDAVPSQARFALLNALRDLADLPITDKQKTLVYIAKDEPLYWDWFEPCDVPPFLVPALTGIALVDGLPTNCGSRGWGYESYPRERVTISSQDSTRALCERVIELGFEQVAILDTDTATVTWETCSGMN